MGQPYTKPNTMKAINYTMVVKHQGDDDSKAWTEPTSFYPSWEMEGWTAEEDARDIVDSFNRTLKPGETPRELVRVQEIEETEEPLFVDEEE